MRKIEKTIKRLPCGRCGQSTIFTVVTWKAYASGKIVEPLLRTTKCSICHFPGARRVLMPEEVEYAQLLIDQQNHPSSIDKEVRGVRDPSISDAEREELSPDNPQVFP